jgi:hypothetical protein
MDMSIDSSFSDLASHCRILLHDRPRHKKLWRWGVLYPLYVLAEIAIVSTDLAELLGSAIALSLLFPVLPLWGGVLITGADVLLILALGNPLHTRPVKVFEWVIAALVSPQPSVYLFRFNETILGVCCAHLHGIDYWEDQCRLGSSLQWIRSFSDTFCQRRSLYMYVIKCKNANTS